MSKILSCQSEHILGFIFILPVFIVCSFPVTFSVSFDLPGFLGITQNLVLVGTGSSFGLQNASEVQILCVTGRQWIILIVQICSIVLVL